MPTSELFFYPWYVDRWRSSAARFEMNLAEKGLYRELLDHYYKHGSLPVDVLSLMRISGTTKSEFSRAWKKVAKWFDERDGKLIHKLAHDVRSAVFDSINKQRERAQKGGRARWVKQYSGTANGMPEPDAKQMLQASPPLSLKVPEAQPVALPEALPTETLKAYTRARKESQNTHKPAGPSGLSGQELQPSVGSLPAGGKNREKLKPAAKRNAAPHSRGKAPARRSAGKQSETSAPEAVHITRIVGLHGANCEVEVQGRNGHEVRSMPISQAEELLALAKAVQA